MGKKLTVYDILQLKGKRQLSYVFVTSAEEAAACDEAGIDMICTISGSAGPVRSAAPNTFLTVAIGGGAESDAVAIKAGLDGLGAGGDAVYTGVSTVRVKAMAREKIPVVGHVGLVPYRNTWYGGMRAIGKTADEAMQVYRDTMDYQEAGAIAVEMEVVPHQVATEISRRSSMCIIAMGAGTGCDAQYLFAMDILGTHRGHYPRHAKRYRDLATDLDRIQQERIAAFKEYKADVDNGGYPEPSQVVEADPKELEKFKGMLG